MKRCTLDTNIITAFLKNDLREQAENLEATGMMGIDALHLACADHVDADFFITCDDNLIKRAQRTGKINAKVISILEFVFKEVFNNATND